MEIDGRVMTADEFVRYVENLDLPPPLPTRVFLHHTWRPTPDSWRGLDSIMAMKAYYERLVWEDMDGRLQEGWTAGPHLFVAEDGIWLFSDLRYDGVGVYGHNYRSRHLEMVGNYDAQLPSGAILENTIATLGILHERLGLDVGKLDFHRDYSNKSCPGWAVQKEWIIPQVTAWAEDYRQRKEEALSALRRSLVSMIRDRLVPTNPRAALAETAVSRGLLGALTDEIPMEIDYKGYVVQFFAEALIVPVNQWDMVQSLQEYEQEQEHKEELEEGEPEARLVGDADQPEIAAAPSDPFDYTRPTR